MKKMTRMKLVNWHYIVDSTIDFKGNVMITGDNGAGKSTILDAIQYVLCGGRTKFNQAAHEKAKRDLLGYVRCKTGKDENEYERNGDVTSHVSIEFYEEKKKKYFIIGTVIDSASNLSNPKVVFYRIENKRLSDDLYFKGDFPRNISDFRVQMKGQEGKLLTTLSETQKDFSHRFGSLNNRFFELLPKALAFRPIENVKDFVYSYILDRKEVNIEYLKENVRTYLEFEKILKEIKSKLSHLENIDNTYNEVMRIEDNIKIHDYIIHRANKEIEENKFKEKQLEEKGLIERYNKGKNDETSLDSELSKTKVLQDEIHTSLLHNDVYNLMNSLQNEINNLKSEHMRMVNGEKNFDNTLKIEINRAKSIFDKGLSLDGMNILADWGKSEQWENNTDDFIGGIIKLEDEYKTIYDKNKTKQAQVNFEKQKTEEELQSIEKDIKMLEARKLVYEENIITLKEAINEGLKAERGVDVEPRIICELLQISDPLWKDAVEGYLNTQRFNLLVNPEYFDTSLGIYDRIKSKRKIFGVGLINTQKLDEYSDYAQDSLAEVVTSQNKYAKLYINMILGKVVRCTEVNDLKKFKTSITPTCMVYQNNTARQINPTVYSKPYIGEDAYKIQLEQKLKDREVFIQKLKEQKNVLMEIEEFLDLLKGVKLDYLRENCSIKAHVVKKKSELEEKIEQLNRIDKSSIIQMQIELTEVKEKVITLDKRLKKLMEENLEVKVNIKNIEKIIVYHEESLYKYSEILLRYEEEIISLLPRAREKYEDSVRNKKLDVILSNFISSRKGFETQKEKKLSELRQLQWNYNRDFHFGGSDGIEGMTDFQRENKVLKESKIIEYEEKIRGARQKAEEEFKDHFISKLQENIKSAQKEFKKLNDALRGIKFGDDEYKFEFRESKDNKKFYDMIMDDSNFGADTLFTEVFRNRHKEAMDELFERITIDDEQTKKALEKFTDYRTYMDYDIKIHHSNGSTSSFSKVCREKSGGETQTPYYVAIVASFIQMYGNSLQDETVGVIMFDEAFDKMDENRIESMMNFINKLNLQVIIAAPPQKIESIARHVSTTLVVTREDNFSWVEGLHYNEEVQQ
jgi:uncharacterized protein YPO0396